jgi:hypothetical protein
MNHRLGRAGSAEIEEKAEGLEKVHVSGCENSKLLATSKTYLTNPVSCKSDIHIEMGSGWGGIFRTDCQKATIKPEESSS